MHANAWHDGRREALTYDCFISTFKEKSLMLGLVWAKRISAILLQKTA